MLSMVRSLLKQRSGGADLKGRAAKHPPQPDDAVSTFQHSSPGKDGVLSIPLVSHQTVLHRRRLQRKLPARPPYSRHDPRSLSATQVAGLYLGWGTHYADVWVGTPPQRQTVILDTGTSKIAFPCEGCEQCGAVEYHVDDLFQPTNSSSFHKLTCSECLKGKCQEDEDICKMEFQLTSGIHWWGYESSDMAYIGGLHSKSLPDDRNPDDLDPYHAPAYKFELTFGCQQRVSALFRKQLADGECGLNADPNSLVGQMVNKGVLTKPIFALCFARNRYNTVDRIGTQAGVLSLGGVDKRLPSTSMAYTANATNGRDSFFHVQVRKMYLRAGGGGTSATSTDLSTPVVKLDLNESSFGRVIIDSGTTDTYLSRKTGEEFKIQYRKMTGKEYDEHHTNPINAEDLKKEPTILLQLRGDRWVNVGPESGPVLAGTLDPIHPYDVLLAIPPDHYYEYDDNDKGFISRIYFDENSGGVLGANAMINHNILFDMRSNRIGWAESNCNYTDLVKDFDGRAPQPLSEGGSCTTRLCHLTVLLSVIVLIVVGVGGARKVLQRRRRQHPYPSYSYSEYTSMEASELELPECTGTRESETVPEAS